MAPAGSPWGPVDVPGARGPIDGGEVDGPEGRQGGSGRSAEARVARASLTGEEGELPLLVSLPHAGLSVPPETAADLALTPAQIARDGDGQAARIYRGLAGRAAAFVTTDVARAVVDLNRAPDDRRPDGVVKTHTCWDEPVYRRPLNEDLTAHLLDAFYHPYHERLTALGAVPGVRLGIDCHTMAAEGPPVGPDPGRPRPLVCLSNGDGTCPDAWLTALARALASELGDSIALNDPFTGGYITRHHSRELPWLQIELSRTTTVPLEVKARAVRRAFAAFSREVLL